MDGRPAVSVVVKKSAEVDDVTANPAAVVIKKLRIDDKRRFVFGFFSQW